MIDLSTNSKNSITQSSAQHADTAAPAEGFAEFPPEVFDRETSDRRLYDLLGEWWRKNDMDRYRSTIHPLDCIGGVLAARQGAKSNPQRFAVACMLNLQPHWRAAAERLNRQMKKQTAYTGR